MPIRRSPESINVKNSPAWAIIEFYRVEICNCFACPIYREEDGRKRAACWKCEKRLEELRKFCGGDFVDNFSS